jgi:hypothetical protein
MYLYYMYVFQLFVKDNQTEQEQTQIDHLTFIGSPVITTNMSDFKRVCTIRLLMLFKYIVADMFMILTKGDVKHKNTQKKQVSNTMVKLPYMHLDTLIKIYLIVHVLRSIDEIFLKFVHTTCILSDYPLTLVTSFWW